MRPDLVLDEDDKKKRFKKYKTPDEAAAVDQSGTSTEETSGMEKNNKRQLGLIGALPKKKKINAEKVKVTSSLGYPDPVFYGDSEVEESDSEDFLEFVKETEGASNVRKIYSDLAENESFIDPETGMLMSSGILCFF